MGSGWSGPQLADLVISGESWQDDLVQLMLFLVDSSEKLDMMCSLFRNNLGTFSVSFVNIRGVDLRVVPSMVPKLAVGVAVSGRHPSGGRFVCYSGPPSSMTYSIKEGSSANFVFIRPGLLPELASLRPGTEMVFDA